MNREKTYLAIDLKSFFASVECVDLNLNPLDTNLVVADESRTSKTICLAVSPSLKKHGISGRARLFEVIKRIEEVNSERLTNAPNGKFLSESYIASEIDIHPEMKISYIIASPHMYRYMQVSSQIYSIYLKYISPDDICVYSIDEVFMDVTGYLETYGITARELAIKIVREIFSITGITATVGIGTNLYLCKVAMDIVAKHIDADEYGVRIACLNEMKYRQILWNHKPLTDFWRVGKGYAKKLIEHGMFTMGDVARCSIGKINDYHNEELLYKLFGINAELLIDHAWGYEPCTIEDIKSYTPEAKSLSTGQVLSEPYDYEKGRIIVQEMADSQSLALVDKGLLTNQVVLTVGYDVATFNRICESENIELSKDRYGRTVPKHAHGCENLLQFTSSSKSISDAALRIFDREVAPNYLIRRITIAVTNLIEESKLPEKDRFKQIDLFDLLEVDNENEGKAEKEKKIQNAILEIKKKHGNNMILRGFSFKEGATGRERNKQIGGHKA